MLHIYAALAEKERALISQRTKAALKAAKARGTRLGNPNLEHVLDDLAAELRLRGSEPPYDAVQVETAEMRDEIIRMGPESLSDEATERINRYLHLRKRPKN